MGFKKHSPWILISLLYPHSKPNKRNRGYTKKILDSATIAVPPPLKMLFEKRVFLLIDMQISLWEHFPSSHFHVPRKQCSIASAVRTAINHPSQTWWLHVFFLKSKVTGQPFKLVRVHFPITPIHQLCLKRRCLWKNKACRILTSVSLTTDAGIRLNKIGLIEGLVCINFFSLPLSSLHTCASVNVRIKLE